MPKRHRDNRREVGEVGLAVPRHWQRGAVALQDLRPGLPVEAQALTAAIDDPAERLGELKLCD
jgi:hypothetical protein